MPTASRSPSSYHAFAIAWIALMLLFARRFPDEYTPAMQEDRLVEWATALLFFLAAVVRMRAAILERHVFDGLVALFCFFVAGEEVSWGQRLLGFLPPGEFLAHNTQQELTFHNFSDILGKPKWILAAALLGQGIVLPLLNRWPKGHRLLERIGASAPSAALALWFAAAIALLIWYPVDFTGEWVELLAATLFLASASVSTRRYWTLAGLGTVGAAALTAVGARQGERDPARLTCARLETAALVQDLTEGVASTSAFDDVDLVHKRAWSADGAGYLDLQSARSFGAVQCAIGSPAAEARRRRYAIDPWGSPYWVRAEEPREGARRVLAYSFGPNRRRDGKAGEMGASRGDDVVAGGVMRAR